MREKRTSISDLAAILGVSKATISFVLNGKGDTYHISKGMQAKIHEKAKELAYVPNYFAKGLRHGKTNTIGLLVGDISNAYYGELCKTIQEELYKNGYNVLIVNSNDNPEGECVLLNELIQRSIDGMIISPCNSIDTLIPILRSTHIPFVFTDRIGDEHADFVGINNAKEAEQLISKFSKKPKKLAILSQQSIAISTINSRIEGATKGCIDAKVPYEVVNLPIEQIEITKCIKDLLDNGVDSFLSLNSKVGLRTLAALKELKMEIPQQVRIVSFDDSEVFSYFSPAISVLLQPIDLIGKETTARILERLLNAETPGKHLLVNCTFIARGSH